jgi:dienelactone hydrolase
MPIGRFSATLLGAVMLAAAIGGCAPRGQLALEGATSDAPDGAAAKAAAGNRLAPERVTFDSLDRDPATETPVRITGLLYRPPNPGGVRRPAIVALHGCGGMYSALASRRHELSLRHRAMAELLTDEGYIVLFPDSFRPRGRDEICTVENRARTITQARRRLDAQGALAHLQARPDVAPERVAALGWSHGGSTVLAALDTRVGAVAAWTRRAAPPYFRAGVAFYPGCAESLRGRGGYAVAAPLTLFVGGADDWTAPQPCIELAGRLATGGEPVTITVYPDAYHGFDGPATQPRLRLDVPNGVNPGKGVTVAPDPAARDDAYARLRAFLREQLAGPARVGSGRAPAPPAGQ